MKSRLISFDDNDAGEERERKNSPSLYPDEHRNYGVTKEWRREKLPLPIRCEKGLFDLYVIPQKAPFSFQIRRIELLKFQYRVVSRVKNIHSQ